MESSRSWPTEERMNGVGETHHDSERCLAAMVVARWCGTGWASVCEPNRATSLVKCAQAAIKSGVFARPVVGSACDEAGYKPSNIRHPAHAGTAPCPPLHAQRKRILMRAGKRVQSQSSTTGTTPSGPCCTKPSPSTSRLGMNLPVPASSTAKAITTPQALCPPGLSQIPRMRHLRPWLCPGVV